MNTPANLIPAPEAEPRRVRATHRTRVIFVDASFVADLHAPVVDQRPVHHAYGQWGAAPLCGTNEWRELVPDGEADCPSCRNLLAPTDRWMLG